MPAVLHSLSRSRDFLPSLFAPSSLSSFSLLLSNLLRSRLRFDYPPPLETVSLYAPPILPFIPLPDLIPSPLIRCGPSPVPPNTKSISPGTLAPSLTSQREKGSSTKRETEGLTEDKRIAGKKRRRTRGKNRHLALTMDGERSRVDGGG